MGLTASFDIDALGYRKDTPVKHNVIDYSKAAETFVEVFLDTAQNLVPVRTGNLMNSIMADTDGNNIQCYTECEYAQYVEYGTWKQQPQPYFEPALEEAMAAAKSEMDSLLASALTAEQEEVEREQREAEMQAAAEAAANPFASFLAQMLAMFIAGLFAGLLQIIEDVLTGGDDISVSQMMSHVHIEVYD